MAEALSKTLRARLQLVADTDDGEAYTGRATWREAGTNPRTCSWSQCWVHWRSARALVQRGLLRYGDTVEDDLGSCTVLHLTDAGRELLAGAR